MTADPTPSSIAAPEDPAAEHARWHGERLRRLMAPDGWLTLVGLDFLDEGEIWIGAGPGVELAYPGCAAQRIGSVELRDGRGRFRPEAGVEVPVDHAAPDGTLVADDAGTPSVIRSGSVSFTLVRRNGRLAFRVRDAESAVRRGFEGIGLFEFDPAAVVEAEVLPPRPGQQVEIVNVTGFVEQQRVAAELRFVLGGAPQRLVATAGGGERLFVVFGDPTNGRETYGGGRFLELPAPQAGRTTIDFNRAFNPPCAFTPFATCPLPPAANRLTVPVRAGELAPGSMPPARSGR